MLVPTYAAPPDGGRMIVCRSDVMKWKSTGFTSQAGFRREPVPEGRDESSEGFASQASFSHAPVLEGRDEAFSGSHTCRARTLAFTYEGSWEVRSGAIHWAARIRCLSSSWDACGTVLEDRPTRMTNAVRHSVEQWIEAFSCGQASSQRGPLGASATPRVDAPEESA